MQAAVIVRMLWPTEENFLLCRGLLFFLQLEYYITFQQELRVRFSIRPQVHSYWNCLGGVHPCVIVIPPETILLRMSHHRSFPKAPSPFASFPVFGLLSLLINRINIFSIL